MHSVAATLLNFGVVKQQVWIRNIGTLKSDFTASLLKNREGILETTVYLGKNWVRLNQCITLLNGQIAYKGTNDVEMSPNLQQVLSSDDIENIEIALDNVYYHTRGDKLHIINLRNDSPFKPTLQ